MLAKIFIAIGVFLSGFLVYVAIQPSDMFISREVSVAAPPAAIFPHINNSKKANEWMPWKDADPNVQMVYSGPEEGVGATSAWDSTGQMGTGQAVVVESVPNRTVKTQLRYTKPMQMEQLAEISLAPANGATTVRWSVSGQNSFLGRLMCVFMDMDKHVGGEFEKGLANLKKTVETSKIK